MTACERLDPETWQCQLEELLALQSVYDEDFRLLAAPGVGQPLPVASAVDRPAGLQPHSHPAPAHDGHLDPEELLAVGPPSELLSAVKCDDDGDSSPSLGCFVAEALVHVDLPEGGLELILEVPLSPPPPPTQASAVAWPAEVVPPLPNEPDKAPPSSHAELDAITGLITTSLHTGPTSVNSHDGGDSLTRSGGNPTGPRDVEPPPPGESGLQRNANGSLCNGDGWTAASAKRGGRGGSDCGDCGRGHGHGRGRVISNRRDGAGRGRLEAGPDRSPTEGRHSTRNSGNNPGSDRAGKFRCGESCSASTTTSDVIGSDWGKGGDRQGMQPGQRRNGGRGGRGRGRGRNEQHEGACCTMSEGLVPVSAYPEPGPSAVGRTGEASAASSCRDGLCQPLAEAALNAAVSASTPGASQPDHRPADAAELEFAYAALHQSRGDYGTGPTMIAEAEEVPGSSTELTRVPFGASVQYLSPIRVTLTLPVGYPMHAPPEVELQALWLTAAQAVALVSELLAQWRASGDGGVPILFLWLDWLRSESLLFLQLQQQLMLRANQPSNRTGTGAAAAVAAAAVAEGPEGLALSLLRYSARREQQKFNESNISCSICLDEQLGQRCVRLPECHDAFCGACLSTHLRTQLETGAVDNMRCPAPECRRSLPPYVLQKLLTQSEYARWESLTLQRTLDKMEDLVYCPRCRDPCLEDKDHCTLCPGCFFSFCALCEDSWHPGRLCLDSDTRRVLLEERRKAAANGTGMSAHERARKEVNHLNELKSLAMIAITAKQCPMCSMGVEKVEGCNKMTCSYCWAIFCWRCNQVIKGYDHFQQLPGGAPSCVLFEQQEINRWNARWDAPRAEEVELAVAVMARLPRNDRTVRLCHCVVCGQRNLKEGGNNDIRCWSCNSHFCYLCRTWLRTKPGSHFGSGRCRQHSND